MPLLQFRNFAWRKPKMNIAKIELNYRQNLNIAKIDVTPIFSVRDFVAVNLKVRAKKPPPFSHPWPTPNQLDALTRLEGTALYSCSSILLAHPQLAHTRPSPVKCRAEGCIFIWSPLRLLSSLFCFFVCSPCGSRQGPHARTCVLSCPTEQLTGL